ncbi:hypothetical protein AQJ43_04835 [Streptomyces avermitilis]|nr:hypothetical protein AQJ43_04835 [Streptomyces avermitilis]
MSGIFLGCGEGGGGEVAAGVQGDVDEADQYGGFEERADDACEGLAGATGWQIRQEEPCQGEHERRADEPGRPRPSPAAIAARIQRAR